jgi:hypothetical protein
VPVDANASSRLSTVFSALLIYYLELSMPGPVLSLLSGRSTLLISSRSLSMAVRSSLICFLVG